LESPVATLPDRPAVQSPSVGEIYDRGYRHYEGEREGRSHAIQALVVYSIKRGLGIKKRWTAKIIPMVLYAFAFFPVIVIIGIRAFLGNAVQGFSYQTLYDALAMILLVFAASTAPEMLADDRRQRVLPLYFSRTIRRVDYLLAKIGALGILMGTIALLPALFMFLGSTFLAVSPISYVRGNADDLLRIIATGTLISLFYASIGLVIASFTDRKGTAAAVYIGAVLVTSAITNALFHALSGSARQYLALAEPLAVPQGISSWIFGIRLQGDSIAAQAGLSGGWYLASVLAVTLICGFVMYRRYLRDE
jgi:ABC-2 type transport system permease protein